MNIFKVLATYDGHIYEPSINAFLAYLLDPYANHGLNDNFFKKFLRFIEHPISKEKDFATKNFTTNSDDYEIFVEAEHTVHLKENNVPKKKDIDIYIRIKHANIDNLSFILIENKIRLGSVHDTQLEKEWEGFLTEMEDKYEGFDINNLVSNQSIHFTFITPKLDKKSNTEFSNLNTFITNTNGIKTSHKVWRKTKLKQEEIKIDNTINRPPESIANLIEQILLEESLGLIDPIYEYSKHTLKALLNFIDNDFYAEKKQEPDFLKVVYNTFEEFKSKSGTTIPTERLEKIEMLFKLIMKKLNLTGKHLQFTKSAPVSFFFPTPLGKGSKMFSFSKSGKLELITPEEKVREFLVKKNINYTTPGRTFTIDLNSLNENEILELAQMQYEQRKSLIKNL